MSELVYEASVYTRTVHYKNFKGEERTATLYFALDPLQLMRVIATFEAGKPNKRSGNPAAKSAEQTISEDRQIKFVQDLANRAAGVPSDDGESWETFEDFGNTIAGQAFMTRLASSDADRKEFAEKVILDPFRAFVGFAEADGSNSSTDVAEFKKMLSQMENIFTAPQTPTETLEQRKARLAAELEALGSDAS